MRTFAAARKHFLMKRLRNVAVEMALHVLAYNLTRVMNIVSKPGLIAAIRLAGRTSRVSIRSRSDREGVNRRIDWPGQIVRSERTP